MEIWGFGNFPFGLVVDPTTMQNFSFLGHLEVPKHLYQSVSQSLTTGYIV